MPNAYKVILKLTKHILPNPFITVFIIGLLFIAQISSANNNDFSLMVSHTGSTYYTTISTVINKSPSVLFTLLTSYNKLNSYSRLIQDSSLLANGNLLLKIKACFAFICFNKKQVMKLNVSYLNITATIIPEQSDFKSGQLQWRITKRNNNSYIEFSSTMTPKFWIPPFIGPFFIKKKLREEALYSIAQIEKG